MLKLKNLWAVVPALCIACVVGAGLRCGKAAAQTEVERARVAAEVAKVAGKLPAESQEAITRLTLLGQLPDGTWKTHSGDVAHGEDKKAELRKAVDEYRAAEGLEPVEWEE